MQWRILYLLKLLWRKWYGGTINALIPIAARTVDTFVSMMHQLKLVNGLHSKCVKGCHLIIWLLGYRYSLGMIVKYKYILMHIVYWINRSNKPDWCSICGKENFGLGYLILCLMQVNTTLCYHVIWDGRSGKVQYQVGHSSKMNRIMKMFNYCPGHPGFQVR